MSGPGKGIPSIGSQSSLRGAFPESIQEDSRFEEPQEFRTRCSSMVGSLQRKPGEGVVVAPTRRRHASAPNHVQPSDADKNRTMLFQVGESGWKEASCCTVADVLLSEWVKTASYLLVGMTVKAQFVGWTQDLSKQQCFHIKSFALICTEVTGQGLEGVIYV